MATSEDLTPPITSFIQWPELKFFTTGGRLKLLSGDILSQRQNVPLHYAPPQRHNVPTYASSPATFCPTFSIWIPIPRAKLAHISGISCLKIWNLHLWAKIPLHGLKFRPLWKGGRGSSGFWKYSSLLFFQLFSWCFCLCLCLCNCLCLCICVPLPFLNSY